MARRKEWVIGQGPHRGGWNGGIIRDVMRSIENMVPIPRKSGRTFLDAARVNRTPGDRMSVAEWQTFSDWCGHQHVPGEGHWHPGAIDIDALLSG